MDEEERKIMGALVMAWNKFVSLPSTHPDQADEFRQGIHLCQSVVMHRIVQRDHPDDFPTFKSKEPTEGE